jgi:2-polyprenyl-6-hydroxyphenyl methylase / 3-demethylubiquinone-9 3-methyltransferase
MTFATCLTLPSTTGLWSSNHRRYGGSWPARSPRCISSTGLAEALAHRGAVVVAFDASERSIDAAREHAKQSGVEIDYRLAHAEEFDPTETFDAVMAVDVLEHVDNLDRTLDVCASAVRPGGLFGFLTHNQTPAAFEELIWNGEYRSGLIPKGNHDFHKFISPDELSERLAARNLRVTDLQGLVLEMEPPAIRISASTDVSYIGYAIKE